MRHPDRLLRGAATFVVLAAAACGGGSAANPSTSAPPATAAPASPTAAASPTPVVFDIPVPGPDEVYLFGPDVTEAEREDIERWSAYGIHLQELMFGREFTTVTIIASGDVPWLAQKDCETRPASMPNCVEQQTNLFADSVMGGCRPAPVESGCSVVAWIHSGLDEPWFKALLYAHELHHVLHGQIYPEAWRATMVPRDEVWSSGPVWLLEGAATWVGERAAIDQGLVSLETRRAEWEEWSRTIDRPLDELESLVEEERAGFSYWYYALAIDELLALAPNGPASLTDYYEATADGVAWETAFEQAFGISVPDFYAEFERIRP